MKTIEEVCNAMRETARDLRAEADDVDQEARLIGGCKYLLKACKMIDGAITSGEIDRIKHIRDTEMLPAIANAT